MQADTLLNVGWDARAKWPPTLVKIILHVIRASRGIVTVRNSQSEEGPDS